MRDAAVVDGFYWQPQAWGRALRSGPLDALADHFFTSLPLRLRGTPEEEARDWARVADAIGVPPERLVRLDQVHGHAVHVVRGGDGSDVQSAGEDPLRLPAADIVLTNDPKRAVVVQVADCVPLLMADRLTGAVAAAHAGWRGTALNVAGRAVAAMAREFGTRPADLVVAHGPSIGACCYLVGAELVSAFRGEGFDEPLGRWFSLDADGHLRLDLWTANRDQLVAAGVPAGNIHLSALCTASHPEVFPSYRRDGKGTGRIAAAIRTRRREP
jgi:polyphenol oxidase